jgi:hypothetical protein
MGRSVALMSFGAGLFPALGHFPEQDFDRFLDLAILSGGKFRGLGPDDKVGFGAVQFHVFAIVAV